MEIILKHLEGDAQYRFLENLLQDAEPDLTKRIVLIQAIMDEVNSKKDLWLIWSNEHEGWWAPGRQGYVKERDRAGRYSYEEAITIVRKADYAPEARNVPNETMMRDVK